MLRLAHGTQEIFDAESLLEEYLADRPHHRRFAWPAYDGLVTNGDPAVLVTGDLLAPTLLGTDVDLDTMRALTVLLPQLQRGLAVLPAAVALADADDAVCDAIGEIYCTLDSDVAAAADLGGSLLAKVLHRKRPELVPLYDSRVLRFYRDEGLIPPSRVGERNWQDYMAALARVMREDLRTNAEEFQRLTGLAADGPALTPLRVLDIVVWTSGAA